MLIGFLPLSSYFSTKKDVKAGTKCPQEQEDLIRALILKDALDKLGCTYDKMKEKKSKSAKKKKEGRSKSEEEDMFSQIDSLNTDQIVKNVTSKPLIVMDAQNVAMRHGKDKFFSVKGIQIALTYWRKNGHEVVCFVPDYLLDFAQVASKIKIK